MKIFCPNQLKELSELINLPIYIVGGFIRNQLLNLPFLDTDIDICSYFSVEEFTKRGIKADIINKSLSTAKIIYKGMEFEYTRFRREQYGIGGGHTPNSVEFISDIREDALRRDFTINSIYYDVREDKIVDELGGIEDLQKGQIRAFNADKVFSSDGLRLMRLARFASELDFDIEKNTLLSAIKYRQNLNDIAPERKRDELNKILNSDLKYNKRDAHYKGLKHLYSLKLFDFILPSINTLDIEQNPKYHKYNVLEHTFLAVKYSPKRVRLAALLHDIAKPFCLFRDGNMHLHALEGALIAKKELSALRYDNKTIQQTESLIRLHMYDLNKKASDSKMRLFVVENFDLIDMLQELAVADGLATGQDNLYTPRFTFFKNQVINDGTPLSISDLKINGTDVIEAGYKGREIGEILDALFKECILNPNLNKRDWLKKQLEIRVSRV